MNFKDLFSALRETSADVYSGNERNEIEEPKILLLPGCILKEDILAFF